MQQAKITTTTEIRVTRADLIGVLHDKYEFLWHFAKQLATCQRCESNVMEAGPYRIYVNGCGDFMLYHRCGECTYPVRSYIDLSQDRQLRARVRGLWLAKYN